MSQENMGLRCVKARRINSSFSPRALTRLGASIMKSLAFIDTSVWVHDSTCPLSAYTHTVQEILHTKIGSKFNSSDSPTTVAPAKLRYSGTFTPPKTAYAYLAVAQL